MKFFICDHCKNVITFLKDAGAPVSCCGEKMKELIANTTDAATEKHVPVVEIADGKVSVNVGSVSHPQSEEHLIEWICLETANGVQFKKLSASDKPEAEFPICPDDEVKAVYAYCNLHGLWKA
ncbi:MAG: desulfoferrodoxin family protein [Oscillospiraceae bacterium]